MNKQELIDYCNAIKENKSQIINCIDVNEIIKKIEQLDEPQKVTIPQFVAEYIEQTKNEDYHLLGAMTEIRSHKNKEIADWFYTDDNIEVFARAWLDGYTIDEKLYLVKVKGPINENILVYGYGIKIYFFSSNIKGNRRAHHTRKQLEEAGFGEVFNSTLFEVEEVEG